LLLKCHAMGRSSEWSVPKDLSERVSGLARCQVSHTVYQNGPSRRRSLLGRASRPFRPQSRSSKPSGPEARLLAWNHPTGGLRPLSRAMFTKHVSSAATAAGLPSLKEYSLRFGGTLEQPTTRHSLRCHQIHGEMVQRIIYRQRAMNLAPYMQATPVLEPFTRYTMLLR
jgi:hypothetical protein